MARRSPDNEHWHVTPSVICIKLTRGRYALVDSVDYPIVASFRWYTKKDLNTYYAHTSAPKPY